MTRANGYFEALLNHCAYRETEEDRRLIARVTEIARLVSPGTNARWAGSQRKGTAIATSDLDLCVESTTPMTEAQRRELRTKLEAGLARPARILSHAIRLDANTGRPRVDIAFANAAFGSRPLPDAAAFHHQRGRQLAARAMKLWTREGRTPYVPGWAVEALVVHLDAPTGTYDALSLFTRLCAWIEERATPGALEGVLRPAAFPSWNPTWSASLPGRLEALRNAARRLRTSGAGPVTWRASDDVLRWLRG